MPDNHRHNSNRATDTDRAAVITAEVMIVGAGIVGTALACALAQSGISVAIIEAQPLSSDWPPSSDTIDGYDARVSALTVASQHFLQALDVWSDIESQRLSPYRQMQVWDAQGTGSIGFDCEEINQPVLGHIVENRITATALLRKAECSEYVRIITAARLADLEPLATGYRLVLEDGRILQTPLLIAADGANSRIRQLAGFTTREWDYGHHAIVTTVQTENPHQQTAWQRFLPEGPLAFLPLSSADGSQHFCSIVWSALPGYAENLLACDDHEFAVQLGAAFEHRLGNIEAVNCRFSFPLRQRHAQDYIQPGLVLVGDAAHSIHPLAGQGVNLGLMDVQVLAEEIVRARRRDLPVGDLSVLQRYQRRRKAANLTMMATMEGFKRLFEHPALPVRWLRNTGMHWLDRAAPLKRKVMKQAMGL